MSNAQSSNKLKDYLHFAGILTCNDNPYLPSLADIGCGWEDVTALIDAHELFYCKAYRKRTTYLSNEVYFLLKQCRAQKPLYDEARKIYELLKSAEPLEISEIKSAVLMPSAAFSKVFNFLLENIYITAFQNGKILNPSWSTFIYSTAEYWEHSVKKAPETADARSQLKNILLTTMPEKEFEKFIG